MKSISKSLFILFLVAGVLLLLDLGNREKGKKDALKIAVFKMTTRPSLDDTEDGVLEALTQRGYIDGIVTFQPVEETFVLMKQIKPNLKKVGTVWCTSETCSEACVLLARKKCAELGIELLEMSVENTTQILEAAMSLTARGVEALWVGGDNVVEAAIDQMINAAAKAKIPLIINNTNSVYGNTLFGLGAKYTQVGYLAGQMAADVLEGKPTSEIGVRNMVPLHLLVNPDALNNIRDKWELPGQ